MIGFDAADQVQVIDFARRRTVAIVLQRAYVEDAAFKADRLLEVHAQAQHILPVEHGALGSAAIGITKHLIDALEAKRDAVLAQRSAHAT